MGFGGTFMGFVGILIGFIAIVNGDLWGLMELLWDLMAFWIGKESHGRLCLEEEWWFQLTYEKTLVEWL